MYTWLRVMSPASDLILFSLLDSSALASVSSSLLVYQLYVYLAEGDVSSL
jgi:hypothetical protein